MNKKGYIFAIILSVISSSVIYAQTEGMARIEGGRFMPFYSSSDDSVTVASFLLDTAPVANAEFLEIVRENPKWRRSKVKSVFAEENYLHHWRCDSALGPEAGKFKK